MLLSHDSPLLSPTDGVGEGEPARPPTDLNLPRVEAQPESTEPATDLNTPVSPDPALPAIAQVVVAASDCCHWIVHAVTAFNVKT